MTTMAKIYRKILGADLRSMSDPMRGEFNEKAE